MATGLTLWLATDDRRTRVGDNAGKLDPAPVLRRQRDEAIERAQHAEALAAELESLLHNQGEKNLIALSEERDRVAELEKQRVEDTERRVANRRARAETQEDICAALSQRLIEAKRLLQEAVYHDPLVPKAPERPGERWEDDWTRRVHTFLKTKSPGETTEDS